MKEETTEVDAPRTCKTCPRPLKEGDWVVCPACRTRAMEGAATATVAAGSAALAMAWAFLRPGRGGRGT